MDLLAKIRTIPTSPGCYLYKNAEGEVIYVGKAKNLRARVRSYFLEANQVNNRKTGSLMREAVDIDYITVANEREALALENNLIKQRKPRFNILLRDDKTYPYIKLTMGDRYPKVFVTRRLRKDGGQYFGPFFPGNLAHRLVDLIHRSLPHPQLQGRPQPLPPPSLPPVLHQALPRPLRRRLHHPEQYAETIRDVRLFLEGRTDELERLLTKRMAKAAEDMLFEAAGKLRDQITTVHQMGDKQRIATADNEDADVFGFHYENEMLAVNLFHMRAGKIVDRRDFFWEDLPDFEPVARDPNRTISQPGPRLQLSANSSQLKTVRLCRTAPKTPPSLEPVPTYSAPEVEEDCAPTIQHSAAPPTRRCPRFSPATFFSALLKQLYLDQTYIPRSIYVPVDFPDRALLADLLSETHPQRIELAAPQRGDKRSLVDLVCQNAKQSYDQRFRVLQPNQKAIQEALQDALTLEELPRRIECFDISHIQGAETVASMVVWEDGQMKKADYRKFQIKTVTGNDDFASMREVIQRRYKRLLDDKKPFPSLVLIDGGFGQLHAAHAALEDIGVVLQPLASIAKKEEIIYVYGQEHDPVVLDRRSPVLHLMQKIRDESHRFAVTYHRKRRQIRDRVSELDAIPGVGPRTRQRLIEHFGSVRALKQATPDALLAVVSQSVANKIQSHFADHPTPATNSISPGTPLQTGPLVVIP